MKALSIYWTIFFITAVVWILKDWQTAIIVPIVFCFIVLVMFIDDFVSKLIDGVE